MWMLRAGMPMVAVGALLTACGAAPSREEVEADVDRGY
jgi:hypothetical protein